VQDDLKSIKEKLETIEDATTELMMGGDTVRAAFSFSLARVLRARAMLRCAY